MEWIGLFSCFVLKTNQKKLPKPQFIQRKICFGAILLSFLTRRSNPLNSFTRILHFISQKIDCKFFPAVVVYFLGFTKFFRNVKFKFDMKCLQNWLFQANLFEPCNVFSKSKIATNTDFVHHSKFHHHVLTFISVILLEAK